MVPPAKALPPPSSPRLPHQQRHLRLAGGAVRGPVIDALHRLFGVERTQRRRLSAMAGHAALRRGIRQPEEARELLVAHHHRRLVVAAAAVTGLAGDTLHYRLSRALLVARVALQADRLLPLLRSERGGRARMRPGGPDAVRLGVAGPAGGRTDQIGRERSGGKEQQEE